MIKLLSCILVLGCLIFNSSIPVTAAESSGKQTKSGYEHDPGFAGPSESGALLKEADEVKKPALRFPAFDKAFKPWFDWKGQLKEEYGIEMGLAYTSLYQWANDSPVGVDDKAGSGIFRVTTRWTPLRNEAGDTGTLVAMYDHRHAYTQNAPGDFGNYGYYGISGALFTDFQGTLGDLNWQQTFAGRRVGIVVGRYDPNDYFDVLGYANPWTSFQNLYILFNGSIALPDWSTGIGAGFWVNDQIYLKAAANDVNGVTTKEEFNFDFDELYTTAEIGWSPSRGQRYFQNLHLTWWHADAKENNSSDRSDGFTIGANWTVENRFMVFTKVGWSDGSAPLYEESYTFGMLYYLANRSDLIGLALNWGDPPSGSGLQEQTTTELFYRLQFAQNLAITPSVQHVNDPALNPAEDYIVIFGLRLRVTL